MPNIFISAVNNSYILYFDMHKDCKHAKKLLTVSDYKFVFCKQTQSLIAIYCPEGTNKEDIIELIKGLAELSILTSGTNDPTNNYIKNLATVFTNVENISFV